MPLNNRMSGVYNEVAFLVLLHLLSKMQFPDTQDVLRSINLLDNLLSANLVPVQYKRAVGELVWRTRPRCYL